MKKLLALGVALAIVALPAPAQAIPGWPPLIALSGICEDGTNPWETGPCHFVLKFDPLGGQGGFIQAYTVGAGAVPQADFVPLNTQVWIAPNATRSVITVNVVDDALCEQTETFKLVLTGGILGQSHVDIPRSIKDGDC